MERLYDLAQIIGDSKKGIPPMIPMSSSTFYERVKNGVFPSGFRCGARRYWTEADVETMIAMIRAGKTVQGDRHRG